MVLSRWIQEVEALGEHWVRCSELLAAYGYGKPTQYVEINPAELSDSELRRSVLHVAEQWREEEAVQ